MVLIGELTPSSGIWTMPVIGKQNTTMKAPLTVLLANILDEKTGMNKNKGSTRENIIEMANKNSSTLSYPQRHFNISL